MHIRDQHLAELREHGFALIEGFLEPDLLRSVQAALWEEYPRPQDYFSDPSAFSWLADSPIAGVKLLPFRSTPLNRLALHPDLIDAVERYLGTTEIDLYNAELWAKYAGAADYEQSHHRDYMNHTLVVPRADGQYAQVTCIMYLSDVSDGDGPTAVIPVQRSADVPIVPAYQEPGELIGREVRAVAPAGSLLLYRTDVLHRATGFTNPSGTRFVATSAYQARRAVDRQDIVAGSQLGAGDGSGPSGRVRTGAGFVWLATPRPPVLVRTIACRRSPAVPWNRSDSVP